MIAHRSKSYQVAKQAQSDKTAKRLLDMECKGMHLLNSYNWSLFL
jgi:hypothetical protein